MATSQNSELSEIKNMIKLLLQREISRYQNSTSNPPSPACNTCNRKGHLAKDCLATKTCFKCNTKGHIEKFLKNDPNIQTCCEETFEKTNIIHETVSIDNVSRILITQELSNRMLSCYVIQVQNTQLSEDQCLKSCQ